MAEVGDLPVLAHLVRLVGLLGHVERALHAAQELAARGIRRAADLAGVPDGTRVKVAGAVICRSPCRIASFTIAFKLALRSARMRFSTAATSSSKLSVVLIHQIIE